MQRTRVRRADWRRLRVARRTRQPAAADDVPRDTTLMPMLVAAVLASSGVALIALGAWLEVGLLDWIGLVAGLLALLLVPAMCTADA